MSKKVIDLTEITSLQEDDTLYVTRDPTTSPLDRKITVTNFNNWPHGSFSSNATQTCTGGTTADAITYSDTEDTNWVTLSNNSRINIAEAGTYLITFSAVAKSTSPNIYFDIWMAIGGSPVARSNTRSRFVGSANERIITVTYVITFTAGQYFELYMWSDSNGTVLLATGTQTNPTRPASPSIIVTVNKIGS